MEELIALLRQGEYSISSIESLSAGLFGAKLAEVPHASEVFVGSLVTYQTRVKLDVLNADKDVIETYGVISKECAFEMAKHGRDMFESDFCISCTGNAGPSVMDDKEVGLVYSCVNFKGEYYHYEYHFKGERNEIRELICEEMKKEIIQILKDKENN